MNEKLQRIFENLIPFFMLGIALALLIGLFIMFSYVLFWGLLIGGVLWLVSSIKTYFFPSSSNKTPVESKGRIIEHDEEN